MAGSSYIPWRTTGTSVAIGQTFRANIGSCSGRVSKRIDLVSQVSRGEGNSMSIRTWLEVSSRYGKRKSNTLAFDVTQLDAAITNYDLILI